jgi:hypothetical protein
VYNCAIPKLQALRSAHIDGDTGRIQHGGEAEAEAMGQGKEMHEVKAEDYITGSKRTALTLAEGMEDGGDRLVRVNAELERNHARPKVLQFRVDMTAVQKESEGREAAARKTGGKAKDMQGAWKGVENVNGCGPRQRKLKRTNGERVGIVAVRNGANGRVMKIVY